MRHPRTYADWEWDDGNRLKLARRGIREEDVEAVGFDQPEWRRNKRGGTAPWTMTGPDKGGRWLRVMVLWADEDAGTLRAISAWVLPARRLRR